jgi:transcriptional regulator with XRE-family HTH domain
MNKSNFDQYLAEKHADPAFADRFHAAGRQWDLALEIARLREQAGLTQKQLAERIGTTQQQISRLERPNYRGSLTTLERVADALGMTVEIRLHSKMPAKKKLPAT